MKLDKNNCRSSYLSNVCGTASIEAATWSGDWSKVRVVEVPKVWREDGKQYKVTFVTISLYDNLYPFIVKAPRGCTVNAHNASSVEYYD